MKNWNFLIILSFILLLGYSCAPDSSKDNASISPQAVLVEEEIYERESFIEKSTYVSSSEYKFWKKMFYSYNETAVHLKNGEVVFSKLKLDSFLFKMEDGMIENIHQGEISGEFNFIPFDKNLEKRTLWKAAADYLFKFNGTNYFVIGGGMIDNGRLFELVRNEDEFSFKEILDLGTAPYAIAIYRGKIYIAGRKKFSVVENFKKKDYFENAFWQSLNPNSIVVKNENEIYVGMSGGYAILSLKDEKAKFFYHNSVELSN